MRSRRRALSSADRQRAAAAVARLVGASEWFRRSRRIAVYMAVNGELDPAPIAERIQRLGKQCYLPVLCNSHRNSLWFVRFDPQTRLRTNRYGIPEPEHRTRSRRPAMALDLLLIPLVAFDPRGHRIGMGGGFYDRTLAFLLHRRHWRKPRLVGLAYEFQKLARIDSNPWDVPLDAVVSERAIYHCSRPKTPPR